MYGYLQGIPFVGRRQALRRLSGAFDLAIESSSQIVIIEGDSGMGKTFILNYFLSKKLSNRVVRFQGAESETHLDFSMMANPIVSSGNWGQDLSNSLRTLGPDSDPLQVGTELVGQLRRSCHDELLVLVVDDLQWADKHSVDLLLFILRRLSTEKVVTILLSRTGTQTSVYSAARSLSSTGNSTRILLGPFGFREAGELFQAATGIRCDSTLATKAVELTGGNPLYLSQLFRDFEASDVRSLAVGHENVIDSGILVRKQFESLGDLERLLVVLGAILGADFAKETLLAGVAKVEAKKLLNEDFPLNLPNGGSLTLAQSEINASLYDLISRGILTTKATLGDEMLGFPHQLIRQSVLDIVSPSLKVALHAICSEITEGDDRLLHLIESNPDGNVSLSNELFRLAFLATSQYNHHRAGWLFMQAWKLNPDEQWRVIPLQFAILAYIISGDVLQSNLLKPQLIQAPDSAWKSYLLGCAELSTGKIESAVELLYNSLEMADLTPGHHQVSALTRLALCSVASMNFDGRQLGEFADRTLIDALGEPHVESSAMANKALSIALTGSIQHAIEYVDEQLYKYGEYDDSLELQSTRALFEMWQGRPQESRERLKTIGTFSRRDISRIPLFYLLAEAELRCGNIEAAAQNVEIALDLCFEFNRLLENALVYGLGSIIYTYLGDSETAIRYLKECEACTTTSTLTSARVMLANARLSFDRINSMAYSRLSDAEHLAKLFKTANLGMFIYPTLSSQIYLEANEPSKALKLLEQLSGNITSEDTSWAKSWIEFTKAQSLHQLSRFHEADIAFDLAYSLSLDTRSKLLESEILCEWAISKFNRPNDSTNEPIYIRDKAAEYSQIESNTSAPRRRQAGYLEAISPNSGKNALLAAAYDLLAQTKLQGLVGRLQRFCGIRQYGSLPSRSKASRPILEIELTSREKEVLGLLQIGMNNKAIANSLFVSVKTVEYHLSNIYLKFSVKSRTELLAKLSAR